jgi:hypothetical protein
LDTQVSTFDKTNHKQVPIISRSQKTNCNLLEQRNKSFTLNLCLQYPPLHVPHTTYTTAYTTYPIYHQWHPIPPHTAPYSTILYILYLSYTAIHINTIPSPVIHAHSWINTVPIPVIHAHNFQLASPSNTPNLSSMSYPADYDGDDPPPFIYDTHDSDDEDDSDDEAGCGGVRYNGDGVDKKIRLDKNIPAKTYAQINLLKNMASTFLNWKCTLPFNITPRT